MFAAYQALLAIRPYPSSRETSQEQPLTQKPGQQVNWILTDEAIAGLEKQAQALLKRKKKLRLRFQLRFQNKKISR